MNVRRPRVLFVSHSASRNGATILLLSFLRWLRPRVDWDIDVLMHGRGALLDEFRAVARTIVWRDPGPKLQSLLPRSFAPLKRGLEAAHARLALPAGAYDLIYANTTAAAPLIRLVAQRGRTLLWHVHELSYATAVTLTRPEWIDCFRSATRFVAVSDAVRTTLVDEHRIDAERIDLVYGFIAPSAVDADAARAKRVRIREALGIRADAFVVGACGSLGWRKGSDLFLQVAQQVASSDARADNICFLWVGGTPGDPAALEFQHDLRRLGLARRCHLVTSTADVLDHYWAMDAFALPSREDPFPLVVLEAADHGLPILCFDRAGGANEFVADGAGLSVPYLDVAGFSRRIIELRDAPERARELGARARLKAAQAHRIDGQGPKLLQSMQQCLADGHQAVPAGPAKSDAMPTARIQ